MKRPRPSQAGFSMIELLLAAFILAIGLLGLTMLQTMAIKTNTSSGNQTRAIAMANRVLETAAMEGRRSMLWKTEGSTPIGEAYEFLGDPGSLATTAVTRYYTASGASFTALDDAKATGELVFTVQVTPSDTMEATGTSLAGVSTVVGRSSLFRVQVQYIDNVTSAQTGTPKEITRAVRLARRISHA